MQAESHLYEDGDRAPSSTDKFPGTWTSVLFKLLNANFCALLPRDLSFVNRRTGLSSSLRDRG